MPPFYWVFGRLNLNVTVVHHYFVDKLIYKLWTGMRLLKSSRLSESLKGWRLQIIFKSTSMDIWTGKPLKYVALKFGKSNIYPSIGVAIFLINYKRSQKAKSSMIQGHFISFNIYIPDCIFVNQIWYMHIKDSELYFHAILPLKS